MHRWIYMAAAAALIPAVACRSGRELESTGIDTCDGYITAYEHCLRKTGMPAEQIARRIDAMGRSMKPSAAAGDTELAAAKAKCVQATKQMEQSCK